MYERIRTQDGQAWTDSVKVASRTDFGVTRGVVEIVLETEYPEQTEAIKLAFTEWLRSLSITQTWVAVVKK